MKLFSIFEDENGEQLEVADKQAREGIANINQTLGELEDNVMFDISGKSTFGALTLISGRYGYEWKGLKKGKYRLSLTADNKTAYVGYNINGTRTDVGNVTSASKTFEIELANDGDILIWYGSGVNTNGISNLELLSQHIGEETTNINSNLIDLKMLGWSVPSECPIQNEVNGNQFIQKVGRVDLGTVDYVKAKTGSEKTYYRFIAPNCKYDYDNNIAPNYYLAGYPSISYNDTWVDKCISRESPNAVILDFAYSDTSSLKKGMQGKYFYYELATPITYTIDGNEAISKINDSLDDYGMVNKFDGQLKNGAYSTSNGAYVSASNNVCSVNKIKCESGDNVTIKVDEVLAYMYVFFYSDSAFIGYERVSNTNYLCKNAPSGTTYAYIRLEKTTTYTIDNVGHVGVYINNEIDQVKADLSVQMKNYDFNSSLEGCVSGIVSKLNNGQSTTFMFMREGDSYYFGYVGRMTDELIGGMITNVGGGKFLINGTVANPFVTSF